MIFLKKMQLCGSITGFSKEKGFFLQMKFLANGGFFQLYHIYQVRHQVSEGKLFLSKINVKQTSQS